MFIIITSVVFCQLNNTWVKTITDTDDGLNAPWGIGGAANGYRYIADAGANKIFKISLEGAVIESYGTGQAGYQDGGATVAMFDSPTDVARDGSGNLYVIDKGNGLIRKITSSGEVSTLSTSGQFVSPTGIGATYGTYFYIADELGHKIYKINRNTGETTTVAGTGTSGYVDGSASTAQFSNPVAITVNNNKIYVIDQGNGVIRKIESDNVSTITGSDQFFQLSDIAGPRSGWFYASDMSNAVVYQFSIVNDEITNLSIIAGQEGEADDIDGMGNQANFSLITGISTNFSGGYRAWVCDYSAGKVKLIYENSGPMSFNLLLPSNQSTTITTTPTFSWNQSNDNDTPLDTIKYELKITSLYDGTVTTISDILDTSHVVSVPLNENNHYSWRVTASDLYGETAESSEEQTFFVNATNDSPALVSIPDKTVDEDQSLSFHLSVNDIDNSSDDLVFTAESQNTDLIPNDSIIFSNTTNYSAEFDGSSGTIEIDNIIIDSTAFTMEGWFKANTLPSGDYYNLLCYGDSYYTEGAIVLTLLKGDNQLHPRVWVGMGGWAYWFAGGNVSLGTWNHLSVIKDGAFYRLLLNGNQVAGPFDFSSHTLASNSIFTVGELQAGAEYFDGKIDEVRIWREALSNDFIQNNMNYQVIADSLLNLVGLYHFNEGAGSVAIDATGNGNDGSLTDILWSTDLPYFTNHLSSVTLTPAQDWNGTADITVTVTDAGTLTDSETFTLTVNAVNDAPVASSDSVTTIEDTDYTGRLSTSDADGDTLTYSIVTSPSNGSLTLDSLTALNFDGDGDYVELNNFQPFNDISAMVWVKTDYTGAQERILDYDGGGGNDMFFVGVANGYPLVKLREDTNSPLVLTGSSMIANNEWHHITYVRDGNQNYLYVDGVLEDNSDGNEFLVDNTVNFFISSSTPSKEFDGKIDEVVIWNIALNFSQIQSYMGSPPTGDETGLAGFWNFNEGTGTTLTDQTSNGNDGTIYGATWYTNSMESFTYSPLTNFYGSDSLLFGASDGMLLDTGRVIIVVTNIDDLPEVANSLPDITVNEDAPDTTIADLDVVFMDIDDALEYSHTIGDTTLVFAAVSNDTVTLQFFPDANGSTTIIFTATNPVIRASVSDTMTVTILPINDPPVITALDSVTISEDSSAVVNLFATNVDEDTLEYSASADTSAITTNVDGTNLTLTPASDWNGQSGITVIVTDGTLHDTTTFVLMVLPVNDAPPVLDTVEAQNTNEDTILMITLSATDVDGDNLTYTASSSDTNVTVLVSNDTLSMTPADNWNGNSTIMVVVSDGSATDTTSFELTVNPVNDAPSSFALNEQDSVYIVMANFDSDSIVFTWDESADVDEDDLTYHFTAELVINDQLTTEYDTTLSNNEMLIDYKSVFDEIYAAQSMLAAIEWDVSVSDGVEEVMAENGPLTVGINASDAVLSIDEELLPDKFALHQNYPNPFNPVTTLRYDLPENSLVNIIIYDLLGRQVKTLVNQTQDAGFKSVLWNATNDYGKPVSAGVYLYQIQAGEFVQTKKMVLLK